MKTTPRSEYERRLQARKQTREQLRRKDDHAVSFRTAVFCVAVLVAWVVLGWGVPWQLLLLPIALFLAAIVYHGGVKRQLRVAERAIEHYQIALQRLDGEWIGIGPDGVEFQDSLHPYSSDLDLFGNGSLFQLLNSPVTPAGAKTLASWLAPQPEQAVPSSETIYKRQEAVQALRDQLDLREKLAIIGPTKQSQRDAEQLQNWLSNPGELTGLWIRVSGILLGLLGTAALIILFVPGSRVPLILVVLTQLAFVYPLRKPLLAIKNQSRHAVTELRRIVQIVAALETIPGDCSEIRRLRDEFFDGNVTASESIHQLERQVSQFENIRHNMILAPLAFVTMLGLHYSYSIDSWRKTHGPHVARWFDAVGQFEALLAFSRLHFENPRYSFPQLLGDTPRFVARDLAHPLIPSEAAVANDLALADDCRLLLVSGSNMSGKSTLLRSVGINSVLAWAGAPVCARDLKLSRLRIAAAMRMQDSLQTGTSHFFAELKRIQLVVNLAQSRNDQAAPVLFLLDEILHGTNSHDRLVGAKGVIQSLLNAGALGLVTTHDLALAEMVTELEAPARNVHFRDDWVDGKMTFDYRMRDGVVPKSNALSLMRLLGLDV